jgi:hypothetical protein
MVFGMNYVSGVWRPSTWQTGDVGVAGTGSSTRPAPSGPTIIGNTWNHIAWVKRPLEANNIYIYLNGVSCGTVACGTNASTDSAWNAVTIGSIQGFLTSFAFRGRISNVRVSNLAMYISNFTPPDVLQTTAQTVFLLVDYFKDKISNVSLTPFASTGVIETYNEIESGKPFELRYDTQTVDIYGGTNIGFPAVLESRGQYGAMFDTTSNSFRFPISGVYRFEFSIVLGGVNANNGPFIAYMWRNNQAQYLGVAIAQGLANNTYAMGGSWSVTVPCSTLDSIAFRIQCDQAVGISGITGAQTSNFGPFGSVLGTWCSCYLVE